MRDYLCSVSLGLMFFCGYFSGFLIFVFSLLANRLAGKSVSNMIYFVSSGMYNLNSVSQSVFCFVCVMHHELVKRLL